MAQNQSLSKGISGLLADYSETLDYFVGFENVKVLITRLCHTYYLWGQKRFLTQL